MRKRINEFENGKQNKMSKSNKEMTAAQAMKCEVPVRRYLKCFMIIISRENNSLHKSD